jgi:epoxide hydrolase
VAGVTGATADPRPFRIHVPAQALDDLRTRLARTRWPDELPGVGWARGVPLDYLKGLVDYWRSGYDWPAHEARLNALPQFTTDVDGQTLHFIHARSPEPDALPLLLTHGWPGSVVEFERVIGPLTDPARHGADRRDAFHVVAPSIPGFAFSTPLRQPGWNYQRVARAFAELMRRLGYARFGAQGGDFGAFISPELGRIAPEQVVGVHVNAASLGFIPLGPVSDEELATFTDVEQARLAKLRHFRTEEWGYNALQSTRPQTLAYGLSDSPVGQLAWIVEKFKAWTDPARELPEDAVDRDQLLTNVTLYWLTGTAGSSAQIYYENAHSADWSAAARSTVPTGVAVFANDVAIRRFAEQGNTIVHWTDFPVGGHFAAMETPDLLVDDVRAFFRRLR